MKKKKLKKKIKKIEAKLILRENEPKCRFCENYKPRTVNFRKWTPLPEIKQMGIYENEERDPESDMPDHPERRGVPGGDDPEEHGPEMEPEPV